MDREKLIEFVDTQRGQGRSLWVLTTTGHAKRLRGTLPSDLRAAASPAYEGVHYTLTKVPVP
jgi:hypothetical protein